MNNEKGRIYYGAGLDNSQLRTDAAESKRILQDIGNTAKNEGDKIDNSMRKIGAAAVGIFAVSKLKDYAVQVSKVRGEFQQLEVAFKTMLGSADKADALMSQLIKTAVITPFGMSDIANSAKQLLAYGVEAEKVNETLIRLGDIAAGLSIPINDLAYLYGTTMVQGRMYTQDLNQFLNRGIPLTEELAKQFGVTKDKVKELVEAGKVGFPEVEKAVISLTSEGSKFGGLMEAQSKTITGQIANIEDTIEQMFNTIGQRSEGAISDTLGIVNSLIENWETIGKVLLVVISTYGAYKAAVLTVAIAHKMMNITGTVRAFLSLTTSVRWAKDAMLLFNMAVKANPVGLVLSVLAAAASALYLFRKRTDEAADSVLGLARAQKRAGEEYDKEIAKIETLQSVLNNGNMAYDRRKEAIDELKSIIPGYNAQLTQEGTIINNNTEAIKEYLKQLDKQITMKATMDEREEAVLRQRELKRQQEKDQAKYDLVQSQYSDIINSPFYSPEAKIFALKKVGKEENKLSDTNKELQKVADTIADLDREIERAGEKTGDEADNIKSFSEQLADAATNVDRLKEELKKLRSGDTPSVDYAKAISDKAEELKKAQTNLNTLLGVDPKNSSKDRNEAQKYIDEYGRMILSAREQLSSEEIRIERDKITDKQELIDFDRKQTISAIEKMRREALEAWLSGGNDESDFDDSIFQKLINQANMRAAFDADKQLLEQQEKQKEELEEMLERYKSFNQRRLDIDKQFNDERRKIEESNVDDDVKTSAIIELENKRKEAIKSINNEEISSMQQTSDLLIKLFEDASYKSTSEVNKIMKDAEELVAYLSKTKDEDITPKFGFSAEELKALKASPKDIQAIQDALMRLYREAVVKDPFSALIKGLKDLFKTGEGEEAETIETKLIKIGESAEEVGKKIGDLAGELADMFAVAGNNSAAEAMKTVQDVMTSVSNIGEGFKNGIISGIGATIGESVKWISRAFDASARHRAALKEIRNEAIAQQREYNSLLIKQNLEYERASTIFGTDAYGKAANSIKVMKQAVSDLNKELAGTTEQQKKYSRTSFWEIFFGRNDKNALQQAYAGLADIEIKTGHKKTGLFGWGKGKDIYSSILDVYPELIDANGEFNASLAETIMSTRTMSEEDKAALQNIIDLSEAAKEAFEEAKDYLTGIFGELGDSLSDALVDSFRNGTDAAEAFADSVSEMLETLAKQMIYSVTLAPIIEEAQEQMMAVMKNSELTDSQKFNQYAQVLGNLTNDALKQQNMANRLFQEYQDMAAAKGISIFKPDEEDDTDSREASKKGIATASQDSINELNGRMTAVQGHTYDIRESANAITINTERLHTIDANISNIHAGQNILIENVGKMLFLLIGINENTAHLNDMSSDLSDMRTGLTSIKHGVDDIILKGVKFKG